MSTPVDLNTLKAFFPVSSLNPDNLRDLAGKTSLESVTTGRYLFKMGDLDKYHVYLVSGEVELLNDKSIIKTITAGSMEATQPIAHSQPRKFSVRAKTACTIVRVDSNLLDIMLTWDQTGTYDVTELNSEDETSDDWMTHLLQTKAFHRVPPANIQAIFMRMETVPYRAGDKVISQGEEGDYFYILKSGRAMVTRNSPAHPKGMKLAELNPGDSFGEEALISKAKRNANVIMLTNGSLVRLSQQDFINLLNEPLLNWVSYSDAKTMVEEGDAEWLDVRLPAEFKQEQLKNSQNIPLIALRVKMKTLKPTKYILCCDTGRRSSAAAFLLSENGLETCVLKDGLASAPEKDKISSD